MLFLLFQIGHERYALEASHAVEVVPYLALKRIPQAPRGVTGIFNYRGQPVPAVDLCELTLGHPARELLSTRIIVVSCKPPPRYAGALSPQPGSGRVLVGLIAEKATGMMRRDERDFVDAGMKIGAAPYLGPIAMDEKGVIQLLRPEHLLPEHPDELMFTALPEGETQPAEIPAQITGD